MTKPFLLAGAMLVAAPAFAQVNLNSGPTPPAGTAATPVEDHSKHEMTAGQQDMTHGPTVTQGTEGTTHSHTVTSGTEGTGEAGATTDAASSEAMKRFTGVGGPSVSLMDVAIEMLGDRARVDRVMRGRDPNMTAADLLNSAMLTLMQSGDATPR